MVLQKIRSLGEFYSLLVVRWSFTGLQGKRGGGGNGVGSIWKTNGLNFVGKQAQRCDEEN